MFQPVLTILDSKKNNNDNQAEFDLGKRISTVIYR